MIDQMLLDYDPALKRKRMVHYDPLEDCFVMESKTDVTDVIELNKAQYAATDSHARYGDVALVGRIPMTEYYRLKREGVIDAEGEVQGGKEILRVLQGNRGFQARPGRLV